MRTVSTDFVMRSVAPWHVAPLRESLSRGAMPRMEGTPRTSVFLTPAPGPGPMDPAIQATVGESCTRVAGPHSGVSPHECLSRALVLRAPVMRREAWRMRPIATHPLRRLVPVTRQEP
ncbi:hypothetical protein D7W79_22415 [Corallococcus exercitus]|nr:hypothetical protein D7W79_22415 [Corallococcus exercitus]